MEPNRVWSIIAEEIEHQFHLDNPGCNKKVKERKRIEGYLIRDFNEPFSSASATLLSSDYVVQPNDKIHIKLMPCPFDTRPLLALNAPPRANSHPELTEDERLALLQNPPHTQHFAKHRFRDKVPQAPPYAKPAERALTGIPRSMRAESYKQLYGEPMPNSKQ